MTKKEKNIIRNKYKEAYREYVRLLEIYNPSDLNDPNKRPYAETTKADLKRWETAFGIMRMIALELGFDVQQLELEFDKEMEEEKEWRL